MLTLDLLGILFARARHISVQMPGIRPPMICIKAREPQGLQQRFELQKDLILATPTDLLLDRSRVVLDSTPHPPLVFLLTDNTLHHIHLVSTSAINLLINL